MKLLRNQTGFSLTDTLVAAALLGIAGLGLLQFSDMGQKAIDVSSGDLSRFLIILREYISDPKACEINFVGKAVGYDLQLPSLYNSKGDKIVETGDLVENGTYKIKSIKILGERKTEFRTDIVLTFESVKKNIGLIGLQNKHITLLTRTNPQGSGTRRITSCISDMTLASEELVDGLCYDVDPDGNGDCEKTFYSLVEDTKKRLCTDPESFLSYDHFNKKCLPLDGSKRCHGGFLRGFDEKGPICFFPPKFPGSPEAHTPVRCIAGIGQIKWGNTSNSVGKIECANNDIIDMEEGESSGQYGSQKYHWGPPFNLVSRPETHGLAQLKCTSEGLQVLNSSCKPNCVVRGLNYRFPETNHRDKQCMTIFRGWSDYKFGSMQDFIKIENGSSLKIEAPNESWLRMRCNDDGSTMLEDYHCIPVAPVSSRKE